MVTTTTMPPCSYWSASSSAALLGLLTVQNPNFTLKTKGEKWNTNQPNKLITRIRPTPTTVSCYSDNNSAAAAAETEPTLSPATGNAPPTPPPMIKKRRRYRKQYPGEKEGITEEMRFVAMRLRNVNGKKFETDASSDESIRLLDVDGGGGGGGETWQPTMEGFVKYLVDSKLVFDTVERIVDESSHVSYAYFRKTGLERSEGLSEDLAWLSQQGFVIPPPSNPGVTYAKYLEELAEKSPPLFLCNLYNIYFSHIAGGQVIAKQVSEKLLEGRELQFYGWEGDAQELLKGMREKLNMLGEHWSRYEKNRCLREAPKSFRYLGQIVRLIIIL